MRVSRARQAQRGKLGTTSPHLSLYNDPTLLDQLQRASAEARDGAHYFDAGPSTQKRRKVPGSPDKEHRVTDRGADEFSQVSVGYSPLRPRMHGNQLIKQRKDHERMSQFQIRTSIDRSKQVAEKSFSSNCSFRHSPIRTGNQSPIQERDREDDAHHTLLGETLLEVKSPISQDIVVQSRRK